MTHGTFAAYTNGKCRCEPCRRANAEHQRFGRRWYNDLTKAERRFCLVCHTPVNIHPLRACWRMP